MHFTRGTRQFVWTHFQRPVASLLEMAATSALQSVPCRSQPCPETPLGVLSKGACGLHPRQECARGAFPWATRMARHPSPLPGTSPLLSQPPSNLTVGLSHKTSYTLILIWLPVQKLMQKALNVCYKNEQTMDRYMVPVCTWKPVNFKRTLPRPPSTTQSQKPILAPSPFTLSYTFTDHLKCAR